MKLNSSKWIIELNIRTTTAKLRRNNIVGKSLTSVLATFFFFFFFFLYLTLKARTTRERKKKSKKQV